MSKNRRTKKQKQRTQNKRKQGEIVGFKIDVEKLNLKENRSEKGKFTEKKYRSYLRVDLTKTIGITMLSLALELALWHYLSK